MTKEINFLKKLWVYGLFFFSFFFIEGIPFPFIYPKVIFLEAWVGLGLILLCLFPNKEEKVGLGKVELLLLALLFLGYVSLSYSPDVISGLFGPFWRGTGLVFYSAIFISGILLKEINFSRERVAVLLVASGTLVSVNFFGYWAFVNKGKALNALMGNPNATSYWIGTTILFNYFIKDFYTDKKKYLYYAVYLINIAALVLIGSRSSIGGVFLGFVLIGMLVDKRVFKISFAGAGVVSVGLIVEYFLNEKSILDSLLVRTEQFARLGIFEGAWDSFLARPLFGYSIQGLVQGYWHNYTSYLGQGLEWNDNAHNLPLNIMAELGLVGLLLLIVTCVFLLRNIFKMEVEKRASWLAIFLFTSIYALFQPYYVDSAFLILLIFYVLYEEPKLSFDGSFWGARGVKVLVGVIFLVVAYGQYYQMKGINGVRIALVTNGNYRKAWNTVAEQTPFLDVPGSILEINNQVKPVFAVNKPNYVKYQKPFANFMYNAYSKIMDKNMHRPRLIENYSVWLARTGRHGKALALLDFLLEKSGDKIPRTYMTKASIYMNVKDYKNAYKALKKVKELNPNYKNIDANLAKFRSFGN